MEKSTVKTNYQIVALNELKIAKYQRNVKTPKIKLMAKDFDINLLGTITVSSREGNLYIIDGQHRVVLARLKGLTELMALVYEGLSYEEEAEYFNRLNGANGEQAKLITADIFNASIEAKEETSVKIKNIVESIGLKIGNHSADNTIVAIKALIRVFKKYGEYRFSSTIKLINDTWNGESASFQNMIIAGTAEFISIYGEDVNFSEDIFIKQLSKIAPAKALREARNDTTTNSTNVKILNVLFKYYNLKLRSKKLDNKHFKMG